MKTKLIAAVSLLFLLCVVPLAAQNCQAGLPCRQVPWAFPPLPILLSPTPFPADTPTPYPTVESGLVLPLTPPVTPNICPTTLPIAMNYKQKVIGLSPNIYYPLDETGGSIAGDASGSSIPGEYVGVTLDGATFMGGGPAAYFDGVGDRVELSAPEFGGALEWTYGSIAGWFQMDYDTEWFTSAERIILDIQKTDGYITVYKSGPGVLTLDILRGGHNVVFNVEVDLAPGDEWTFFAMQWSPFVINFWVDPADPFSEHSEYTYGQWGRNLTAVSIGANALNGTDSFVGGIGHVSFFNRYLNNVDIVYLANSGLLGLTVPDGCVYNSTPRAPFDIGGMFEVMASAQQMGDVSNINSAPVYDLYGNALNFFSIVKGLAGVDIGPFTPLVIALFAGFFLHVSVWVIERSLPLIAVVVGVIRKLIHLVLDFLPG